MRDYIAATERELDQWPGVSFNSALASKHAVITVVFCGKPRKIFIPASPSDSRRGVKNYLGNLRRTLTDLGAKRIAHPKRTEPQRKRNKPVRALDITQPAPVIPDPFAVLANWKEKTMTRTIEINGKTVTLESNVPVPPKRGFGRQKSDLRLLLEAMRPGESVALPIDVKAVIKLNPSAFGKKMGRSYSYRPEGEGVRVWCTEAKPAKPNGGAFIGQRAPVQSVARSAWG